MIPDKFCTVQSQEFSLEHLRADPCPLVMSLDGSFPRLKSIGLALRVLRGGILMASPVIEDLRNMIYFLRLHRLHTAENKIIILGPVKLRTEQSHLIHHVSSHYKQVADIVHRAEKIRVVIRFKMRLKEFMSVHGHFVLVGIKKPDLPVLVQGLYALVQRVRRQHIVMIGKGDKISRGRLHTRVGVFRNPERPAVAHHADPLIRSLQLVQQPGKRRRFAASVGKAQFPVGISLFTDRIHQLAEIFLRSFIERHHNGYLRLIFKFLMALFLQFPGARQMAQDPLLIGYLSGGRCFYLGNDLSRQRGASLASPVTYPFFRVLLYFFPEYHCRLEMNDMHGFFVPGVEHHIKQFPGNIGQLHKKSCFVPDLRLLVKLFHIYSFCAQDLRLHFLFIFIKNLDTHRHIGSYPAPDPHKTLLYFFLFDKELGPSPASFQFLYRHCKPAECSVRHIRIYGKFLKSVQRFREPHRRCDPLASHKIRILETFQGADHFQLLDFRLHFRTVQAGAHLRLLRPGPLQDITAGIL